VSSPFGADTPAVDAACEIRPSNEFANRTAGVARQRFLLVAEFAKIQLVATTLNSGAFSYDAGHVEKPTLRPPARTAEQRGDDHDGSESVDRDVGGPGR
jgi:hypothetical protein